MILLIVISVVIVLRYVYIYFNRERMKKIKNFKLFDNQSLPFVGDIFAIWIKSTNDIFQYFNLQSENMTETRLLWIFYHTIVVLGNPNDIKSVLSTPYAFEKGTAFCVMGGERYALLTAFSHYWKPLRRNLNSVISISALKSYFTNFNKCSKMLIAHLDEYVDKGEFDINIPIGIATTNAALRSHLNIELNDRKSLYELNTILETILAVNGSRLLQFYYQGVIMWFRKKLKIYSLDIQLLFVLIRKWKPYVDKMSDNLDSNQDENHNQTDTSTATECFMKRLIRLYKSGKIVKHSLYENLVYFIAAAANTNTIAVSFLCLLMAIYPEIAEKLHDEIIEHVGNRDDIDYETLGTMKYLDRVLKETLRLYPAVPLISRKVSSDIQIENGTIPAGSDILISIRSLHRNRNLWGPNADKFDPDNFLPDRVAKRSTCSYMPFAYGMRNCIGYKYATNLNKLLLVQLVKNYKFSTQLKEEDLKCGFAVTLKLLRKHTVKITRR